MRIKIKRLPHCFRVPAYQTVGSVGADLYAAEDWSIRHGANHIFASGIALELPQGYMGQVFGRSGMSARGYLVSPGTIDQDYRGEIKVTLANYGIDLGPLHVKRGDRIAQLIISPVIQAVFVEDVLGETDRGENGFGSSGA